jgi:succinate dehydrogenase / fumarate reductase membrane anchor subunit
VLWNGGLDYALWTDLFAHDGFRLASFLFMVSLLYHAWIGARDILMDYIKPRRCGCCSKRSSSCCSSPTSGWTLQILWGTP